MLTKNAAVVTVGSLHGGVRSNIIPEEVEMVGTIRTLDMGMRDQVHQRLREIATNVAESMGATAEVQVPYTTSYPVTHNDEDLTEMMLPTVIRTAGKDMVQHRDAITGAEDFSFFAQEVPGLFLFLGARPPDRTAEEAAAHHTPDFFLDESSMKTGVRLLTNLTLDYMAMKGE